MGERKGEKVIATCKLGSLHKPSRLSLLLSLSFFQSHRVDGVDVNYYNRDMFFKSADDISLTDRVEGSATQMSQKCRVSLRE